MVEKVGHTVLKLKRIRYAFLTPAGLPTGAFRALTPGEAQKLKRLTGMEEGPGSPPVSRSEAGTRGMIPRRGRIAGRLILALVFLAGCGRVPDDRASTLRINLGNEPPTLDWSLATDSTSFVVIMNIMEGLAEFDEELNPRPNMALKWDVSPDGQRYLFHLRPDAVWTDGRPVTADDYVYAWRRLSILVPGRSTPTSCSTSRGRRISTPGRTKTRRASGSGRSLPRSSKCACGSPSCSSPRSLRFPRLFL